MIRITSKYFILFQPVVKGIAFFVCHLYIGQCDDLNAIGSHRPIGSGTNIRCDLVGIGVILCEEVYHCGTALRIQKLKSGLMVHYLFLLPVDPDVELPASSLASCQPS